MISLSRRDSKYLKIALPAALEGVLMILLANVDLILVSRLGTDAIAAVSIFTQPRMMILTIARSLAAALSLLAAERYGRRATEEVSHFLMASLFFWGTLIAGINFVFYLFLEDILLWYPCLQRRVWTALMYSWNEWKKKYPNEL